MNKIILIALLAIVPNFLKAQFFSAGNINVNVSLSHFHDSNACASFIVESWSFTKQNSFLNDTIWFKDNWGSIINYQVNTAGSTMWYGNFPVSAMPPIVSDLQLINGMVGVGGGNFKVISGVDTIYNINPFYTAPEPNACLIDTIKGKIYLDNNSDCIYNAGDVGLYSAYVQANGTFSSPTSIMANGSGGAAFNALGDYALPVIKSWMLDYQVFLQNNFSLLFPPSVCGVSGYTVTSLPANGKDFALHCSGDIDVQASIASQGSIRPMQPFFIHPHVSNIGCDSASGVYTLIVPAGMAYSAPSSTNLPSYISAAGDTMKWNYNYLTNVTAGAYWNSFFSNIQFTPSTAWNIGDTACFQFYTTVLSNDINASNNQGAICLPVVNSYDPNDKTPMPKGVGPQGNIPPTTSEMNYTIRFQNTGNAPAYTVKIMDTLDADFDMNSLVITGSSHYLTPSVKGREVTFNFWNINLPDSHTNYAASQGAVSYKIKLKPNLPLGTQLRNTAHIYFDFNPAIITNTTINTLQNAPQAVAQVMQWENVALYPNPTSNEVTIETKQAEKISQLRVYNSFGKLLLQKNNLQAVEKISLAPFGSGLYVVELITASGKRGSLKVVKE